MTLHLDIVEEHAEEASFLYGQRGYLRRTGRGDWSALEAIEARIEAHIDGLFVAGSAGVEAARRDAHRDPGAAFASGALAALGNAPGDAAALWNDSPEAVRPALAQGVLHTAPPAWDALWQASLQPDGPLPVRVAARAIGARGLPLGAEMLARLSAEDDAPTRVALIEALGLLRDAPALSVLLHRYATDPDETIARAAILALLASGVPRARDLCAERAREGGWAALALAASGRRSDGGALARATGDVAPQAALALGLHGDLAHVPTLLRALDAAAQEARAREAAMGLYVLTGAPLVQTFGEPEDGTVEVSRDARLWREWWSANEAPSGARTRLGRPYAAPEAARSLSDPLLTDDARRWIARELWLRYGAPLVAPESFVAAQRRALASGDLATVAVGTWHVR